MDDDLINTLNAGEFKPFFILPLRFLMRRDFICWTHRENLSNQLSIKFSLFFE